MPLSSSNAVTNLGNGNEVGLVLGVNVTNTIAFYGATPLRKNQLWLNGSASSGTLASSIAFRLNLIGLIQCTSFAP